MIHTTHTNSHTQQRITIETCREENMKILARTHIPPPHGHAYIYLVTISNCGGARARSAHGNGGSGDS